MTFAQLKLHPSYPFKDFQTDDLSFLLLELYWAELFREIVRDSSSQDDWSPWMAADRLDGNPIFTLICRKQHPFRRLRVIQRFNTDGLVELNLGDLKPTVYTHDAYVPFVPDLTYGATDDDGVTQVEELLISSDISNDCEQLFQQLAAKWCVELVPAEYMRRHLDAYWQVIRQNLVQTQNDSE